MNVSLLLAVLAGIALLLVLILYVRLQAFLALLLASITTGILAGMDPMTIIDTMQEGMGNTLGFVATVVGLGALFGAILEHSGGAGSLARYMIRVFGEGRASWALLLTGFLVAIPVFFDVGFIILVPLAYALQRRSGRSLLLYALPLLAGLAITHAFIPPTPGPVAVADILQADLGWVILLGAIVGLPTAVLAGPVFAKYVSKRMLIDAPSFSDPAEQSEDFPPVGMILLIILVPIALIVVNTLLNSPLTTEWPLPAGLRRWLQLIGHPFAALILANLLAWYFLGIRRGMTREHLFRLSAKSMEPAGVIILLTGAGGVFKQMLVNTGAGDMLATYFVGSGMGVLLFAFVAALVIRVLQGSATVAMITGAGVTAPLLDPGLADPQRALLVIAIAAGATGVSHVNDSGFWLVSKYLDISEGQTFRTWTLMTTLIALVGFGVAVLLSLVI